MAMRWWSHDREHGVRWVGGRRATVMRPRTVLSASLLVVSSGVMGGAGPRPAARELSAAPNAPHVQVRSDYAADDPSSVFSHESLRKSFESALPDDVRATIRWDPSLDCVAGDMALVSAERHRSVAISLERWLFWKCGVVSLYEQGSWVSGGPGVKMEDVHGLMRKYARGVHLGR